MGRTKAVAVERVNGGAGEVRLEVFSDDVAFQLRRAQELSFREFAKRVGSADLKAGDYAILSIVRDNPDINQMALSHATGRDKSTLTATLKRLEARGFIERRRSEVDGRAYALRLTDAGTRHLAVLLEHARAHGRFLDGIVGDEHKPTLIRLLGKIVNGLAV